jgi:hypothetical protein
MDFLLRWQSMALSAFWGSFTPQLYVSYIQTKRVSLPVFSSIVTLVHNTIYLSFIRPMLTGQAVRMEYETPTKFWWGIILDVCCIPVCHITQKLLKSSKLSFKKTQCLQLNFKFYCMFRPYFRPTLVLSLKHFKEEYYCTTTTTTTTTTTCQNQNVSSFFTILIQIKKSGVTDSCCE